jgi:hypothetical protein
MMSRALRSRTAEISHENPDLLAGEKYSGRLSEVLGSSEPSERLGSAGDSRCETQPTHSDGQLNSEAPPTHERVQQPSLSETLELKQMFAGMMEIMKQNNDKLQESVRSELVASQEKLVASQESVRIELSKIRKDIQAENESLIKKFDAQNKQTKREFSEKLEAESRRFHVVVSQVQKETESELIGVKKQLQAVNSDLEAKILQASNATQDIVGRLANHVDEHRLEVNNKIQELGQDINSQLERQKENLNQTRTKEKTAIDQNLAQVNAKIVALENRFSEIPRPAVVIEPRAAEQILPSPSVVHQGDQSQASVPPDENRTCSCQTNNCEVCMENNVNTYRMHVSDNQQVSSFLSSSELPIPLFNESKDTNPVYHIRQLDEFMRFRGVPKQLQLAVANKSLVGQMSRRWAETTTWNLKEYPEWKREFLKIWWSSSRQSLVKCKLYQGKYNRQSGLSLSGYFLEQATTASYLEPKPSDIEIIEAIRYHYPIQVQRAMLSNQLTSIGETLDLLKRVEVMEAGENFQRPHQQAPYHNPNAPRQNQTSPHDRRAQTQSHVRQVQFGNRRNGNNGNWRRRNRNGEETSLNLNPNATPFQGNQHQDTNSEN